MNHASIIDDSQDLISQLICQTNGKSGEEKEANAKLIAAAPDLLQALTEMLESYKMYVKKPNESEYVINAEAAIKKATT